jgi:ABC-type antimicrobial peptide transport system permease subunit
MPGKINAILSFLCLHSTTQEGMAKYQKERMGKLFPGYKVISKLHIAQGRSLARVTTSRYLYCLLALVTCITVIVITVTGLQEVAERRQETGILLAMGAGYPYIVGLYVFKMLGLAAAAALAGFLGGSWLAKALLSPVLAVNTRAMGLVWEQFPGVLGLTVLVAVAATALPMLKLVRTDPNLVLTEE